MTRIVNGMPAGQLEGVTWQKSGRSNPSGNCVECAALPDGSVAMRNSRDPEGAALIYDEQLNPKGQYDVLQQNLALASGAPHRSGRAAGLK